MYKLSLSANQNRVIFPSVGKVSSVRVFKNLSYKINIYQLPCYPFKEMLPCVSFNFLHHDFIYETERSAWPSYGQKNEIGNIKSAPKKINDQIICVNLNIYVDVNSDPTRGRNVYLQPCTDTENCQS